MVRRHRPLSDRDEHRTDGLDLRVGVVVDALLVHDRDRRGRSLLQRDELRHLHGALSVRLVRRHEKALAAACKAGSRASFGSSPKRFAH